MSASRRGAPSSAGTQQLARPLNDSDWQTFILTFCPDTPAGHANWDGQTLPVGTTAMLDAINAGYRQRFTVVSESDVMEWANENAKVLDYCKDAKTLADAKEQIPDALKAKLFKGRLQQLKAEGIEAKTPKSLGKDTADAISAPAQESPDKKDAKAGADKDKAKSAAPKDTPKDKDAKSGSAGKGKSGGKTDPTPPDSAPPAEQSKRKNKLRDRGSARGTDPKLLAIDDEPQDGPDAYYVLTVRSPGVLGALMDELDSPVQAVVRVEENQESFPVPKEAKDGKGSGNGGGGAQPTQPAGNSASKATVRTIVNPALASLRLAVSRAAESSRWHDVAFLDIPLLPSTSAITSSTPASTLRETGRDLFEHLAKKCYDLLARRRVYDAMYAKATPVRVLAFDPAAPHVVRARRRLDRVRKGHPDVGVGVEEMVLGAVLDEVCKADGDEDGGGVELSREMEAVRDFFDRRAGGLVGTSVKPKEQEYASGAVMYGDQLDLLSRLPRPTPSTPLTPGHVLTSYQRAAILAGPNLTAHAELADRAFQLERTRVREAAGSWLAVERALELMEVEEACGMKEGATLDEYVWEERFDKDTLAQVIRGAKLHHPFACLVPHLRSSSLLLILSGSPSPGCFHHTETVSTSVVTRVGFGAYLDLIAEDASVKVPWLVPGGKHLMGTRPVYYAGGMVVEETEEVQRVFPAANEQIEVRSGKSGRNCSIRFARASASWCTSKPGSVTVTFEDNSCLSLSVSEANECSCVFAASDDGMTVQVGPEGNVKLYSDDKGTDELYRVVTLEGITMTKLPRGESRALLPDGSTFTLRSNGEKVGVSPAGIVTAISPSGEEIPSPPPVQTVSERIRNTGRTTISRADLVVINEDVNGTRSTEHADGTVIVTTPMNPSKGPRQIKVLSRKLPTVVTSDDVLCVEAHSGCVIKRQPLGIGGGMFQVEKDGYEIKFDADVFEIRDMQGQAGTTCANYRVKMNGSLEYFNEGSRSFGFSNGVLAQEGTEKSRRGDLSKQVSESFPEFNETSLKHWLSRLCSKSIPNESQFGDFPRVFFINVDGRGRELLRDVDVLPFLRALGDKFRALPEASDEDGVTFTLDYRGEKGIQMFRKLTRRGRAMRELAGKVRFDLAEFKGLPPLRNEV